MCLFKILIILFFFSLSLFSPPSFSAPVFGNISLPFVRLMTSPSVASSQFALQFRYSFPWKPPRWTGNGKKLLTHLPAGGLRGLHQRSPLPLKRHFLCGRSGILLAPVCFTSFAWFCSSWPIAGSSSHNSSSSLPSALLQFSPLASLSAFAAFIFYWNHQTNTF